MADPRGKLPGDLGNADWDALLSDLERKDDAPAEAAAKPSTKAPEPPPAVPSARPSVAPLYRPPSATPSAPQRPRLHSDEEDEERTVVGVINRDLIEEATRGVGGLDQLFGKPEPARKSEEARPRSFFEPEGADVSPDASRQVSSDEDHSVMTSAAPFLATVEELNAHDRATPVPAAPASSRELADPFPSSEQAPEISLDFDLQPSPPPPPAATPPRPPPAPPRRPPALPGAPRPPGPPPPVARVAPPAPPAPAAPTPEPPPSVRPLQPTIPATEEMLGESTRIASLTGLDIDQDAARAELLGESRPATPAPPAPPAATSNSRISAVTIEEDDIDAGEVPAVTATDTEAGRTTRPPLPVAATTPPTAPPTTPPTAPPTTPPTAGTPTPATPPAMASTAPERPSTPARPPARPSGRVSSDLRRAPTMPATPARISRPDLARESLKPEAARASAPEVAIEEAPLVADEGTLVVAQAPKLELPDERDAVAFLAETDSLQEWGERAEWLESEARALEDTTARARSLLAVSELLAMSGDEERAQQIASEARELAPSLAMAHRQGRARLARERDFEGLVEPLENEARAATSAAGRAHAHLLAAFVLRRVAHNPAEADRKLEQAARVQPADPRPHLLQIASELGRGQPSRYRWPDDTSLAPLVAATQALNGLRGAFDREQPPASTAEAIIRARAALDDGSVVAAAEALAAPSGDDGVTRAARWLAAALAAPRAESRARAIAWAASLATHEPGARRQQAIWAFEAGDQEQASEALAQGSFEGAERAIARALLLAEPASLEADVRSLADDEDRRPLAAALASALGLSSPPEAGAVATQRASALGRALAAGGETADAAVRAAAEQNDPLATVLRLDLQAASRQGAAVAAGLAAWPHEDGASETFERDRALASAVAYAVAGDSAHALEQLDTARQSDPLHEATARLHAALEPERAAAELDRIASGSDDPARRSLLLTESAARQGASAEVYPALLRLAHETSPDLPFASSLGLEAAQRAGDDEAVGAWLQARLELDHDAADLLRDAQRPGLAPGRVAERLGEALSGHENDVALREEAERLAPSLADPAWRALRAAQASGRARVLVAFRAALDAARTDPAAASPLAQLALDAGAGELARLLRDRSDAVGPGIDRLAEELLSLTKDSPDPVAEREAYERLAALDEHGRQDASAALSWHRTLLERQPGWLPSLRRLEHQLVTEGRDDDLESVRAALSAAGVEVTAQAQAAARLRMRHAAWETTRDLVARAAAVDPPGIWALRQQQAHARHADDAESSRRVSLALADRTDHPGEKTTLLVRAAEAAERLGDGDAARAFLRQALELAPGHLLALLQLASLLDRAGDPEAARYYDEAARAHHRPDHQAPLWYRAAVLWLAQGDGDRATAAFESVAAIDVNHADAFDRLRALLTERGDGARLASLLQRRLATEEDFDRRVELEVALGRALTELGDRAAAKTALAAALDTSPDHVDALRAFVDLCLAEEDWDGAEQALVRLGRLVTDPAAQAELYTQLGDLYRLHLPNFERAELSYLEVLKRLPDSVPARERLVKLYLAQGNKDRAFEIQQALLAATTTPADKRQRTIELAELHEQTGDLKKAEQTLDGLRKEFPQETSVLRALASFHLRHQHGPAANVLLDRAAADARRALATGRFELHFFANLATVFELRDQHEAASIANGTVAALDGRPSNVTGIGLRGAEPSYDDVLAPEIFSPAFRELLRREGHVLDAGSVVDLKGLRAAPLPPPSAAIGQRIAQLAAGFGLHDLQVFTSPTLGSACLPAASSPPTLVLGPALLTEDHEAVRTFLVLRALKCLQAGVAVFCRTAPIDLWPLTAAFLKLHAPQWTPQGVDANKLRDFTTRLQRAMPAAVSPDLATLATEVAGAIGNRASTLQTAANSWGSRSALLIEGDLSTALDAVAWAAGQTAGAPATNPDRMKWIGRNAEARDLIVFSVSDPYTEARKR